MATTAELFEEPFVADEYIERLVWRTPGGGSRGGPEAFDPKRLLEEFVNHIQELQIMDERIQRKVEKLEQQCQKEAKEFARKVQELQKSNQVAFQHFQELDEHISYVATKVCHLGDQLEGVNTPRQRAVEAQKLMKYFNEFLLLPSEKLEEQLPKLLPGVLALYKKHAETVHVSKSLGQILEAAVSVGSRTLDVQLDSLLVALHTQICVPVESSSPLVMSNQKEVLRCFTVLACYSPDRLLAFLLPKLDTSNERTRVGTLQVLRHVINAAAAQMEVKKPFILSSMKLPLLDTNNKVKRAVVQVVSAMAHHGYLEQPGGKAMVEYIVQQCALPPEAETQKPGADSEALAADSVREMGGGRPCELCAQS